MIPDLNQSGVLPPFVVSSGGPTNPSGMAPYKTSITEFVERYAFSKDRIAILQGLLAFRKELRKLGITNGFQWVDGSFVEDVEKNRGRSPNDIDLITFAMRPEGLGSEEEWRKLVTDNQGLFVPQDAKSNYSCDAYFVDLNLNPFHIVNQTRYWFGLFSHQRDTSLWKGMVEIPIICDDDEASKLLESVGGTNA